MAKKKHIGADIPEELYDRFWLAATGQRINRTEALRRAIETWIAVLNDENATLEWLSNLAAWENIDPALLKDDEL